MSAVKEMYNVREEPGLAVSRCGRVPRGTHALSQVGWRFQNLRNRDLFEGGTPVLSQGTLVSKMGQRVETNTQRMALAQGSHGGRIRARVQCARGSPVRGSRVQSHYRRERSLAVGDAAAA